MDFQSLYTRIAPRLKKMALWYKRYYPGLSEDDLYQEMSMFLWKQFQDGLPQEYNDAYVVRGCQFHILNYLRKEKCKVPMVSIQSVVNEEGNTLEELIPAREEQPQRSMVHALTIDEIKNNGFTPKEKKVFALLLEGYTVREVGQHLGVSHVMVLKHKNNLIRKWQNKDRALNLNIAGEVTNDAIK